MSLKASDSSENLILPVSDPPKEQDGQWLYEVDDKLSKGSAMTKRRAYAAISYMSCAVLLVMFNKAALSSYNFPSANVITLLQMVCSCSFLYVLRRWKIISFTAGTYLLYMLASTDSVRGVNVPMYTTLRRTTVVFTMLMEYILVVISVGLIVFGAFIGGARDLSFDAYGYAIVFMSNITTAIYLATKAHEKPAALIAMALCGAMVSYVDRFCLSGHFFGVVLPFSCILAFFLNYSIFLNTTLNSALTQTICGNPKDLFTISLGWILFGGLQFDFWNIIGQLLGFVGSGLYAYYKLIGK